METLIIFIIIAIFSSIFGKDKKQSNKQKPTKYQMPSFGQQTIPEKTEPVKTPEVKSLEDFAKEIFGQLDEKLEEPKVKVEKTQQLVTDFDEARTSDNHEREKRPSLERHSSRPSLVERPIVKKLEKQEESIFAINSRKDLVHGLVMAEILGPPKAKRK